MVSTRWLLIEHSSICQACAWWRCIPTYTHMRAHTLFFFNQRSSFFFFQIKYMYNPEASSSNLFSRDVNLFWTLKIPYPVAMQSPSADIHDFLGTGQSNMVCFAWIFLCYNHCSSSVLCWCENIFVKIFNTHHIHTNHLAINYFLTKTNFHILKFFLLESSFCCSSTRECPTDFLSQQSFQSHTSFWHFFLPLSVFSPLPP